MLKHELFYQFHLLHKKTLIELATLYFTTIKTLLLGRVDQEQANLKTSYWFTFCTSTLY